MAYKSFLTPLVGGDISETDASFMNMKFGELLGNTDDNRAKANSLITDLGSKAALNTTIKTSAVLAINEVNDKVRLQTPTNNDLNNALTKGDYLVTGGTSLNVPVGFVLGNYGVCTVYVYSSTLYQLLITHDNKTHRRSRTGTTWTTWVELISQKRGTGSPEGVVVGDIGDMYVNNNGGAATTLYIKTSGVGNTGWTAK